MKVVIPGGSGQVGTVIAREFTRQGHAVTVLSRNPEPAPWRTVAWDARSLGPWAAEVDGADVVINLAGRTVNCRYDAENRRQIKESRVDSTRVVGEAIAKAKAPPKLWLQAGTATIYAHRYDAANDEATGILGGQEPGAPDTWNFSIDVARSWEAALDAAQTPHTRKVSLRAAMTMSPDRGGVFETLLWLVRLGLGGTVGDGRQYISWIHEVDFLRALTWIIEHEDLRGPVNLAAPEPLPNADFMRALREAWGMPFGLPAMEWMVEVGAFFLRTESELVLKSRRVIPGLLTSQGFEFRFPKWQPAAQELCARYRSPTT